MRLFKFLFYQLMMEHCIQTLEAPKIWIYLINVNFWTVNCRDAAITFREKTLLDVKRCILFEYLFCLSHCYLIKISCHHFGWRRLDWQRPKWSDVNPSMAQHLIEWFNPFSIIKWPFKATKNYTQNHVLQFGLVKNFNDSNTRSDCNSRRRFNQKTNFKLFNGIAPIHVGWISCKTQFFHTDYHKTKLSSMHQKAFDAPPAKEIMWNRKLKYIQKRKEVINHLN